VKNVAYFAAALAALPAYAGFYGSPATLDVAVIG
jgi:hypothetical protein